MEFNTSKTVSANLIRAGRIPARLVATILFGVMLGGSPFSAQAAGAQYVYDSAGRLVQVIAPDGSSAQYSYDLAGNLLAITPITALTAVVTGFSNASGAIGTTTTIYGGGFSTISSANSVYFNGVAATVVSATTNSLTVIIPSGATTGSIKVTDSNGTATSAGAFVVASSNPAPSITSFSPQVGVAGTSVTVNGSNLQTPVTKDLVTFGSVGGTVLSATAGVMTTAVPTGGSSGRISVSTPYGSALSANDFFVPPAGKTATNVAATGRLAIDGTPLTIGVNSTGHIAMVVFDGLENQQISLQVSGETFQSSCNNGAIALNSPGPKSAQVGSASFCTGATAYTLPTTGTYTFIVTPVSTDTGNITLKILSAPTLNSPLAIDGTSVTATTTVPQQKATLTFSSTSANQIVSVQLTGSTYPSGCSYQSFAIAGPAPLTTYIGGGGSGLCTGATALTLPTVGTYTLTVNPYKSDTGSVTVMIQSAPTLNSSITIGGSAVTVTTTVPQQKTTLTFSSTSANQIVSVQLSGSTYPSGCIYQSFGITGPAPSTTYIGGGASGLCAGTTAITLPTVGSYTLTVKPYKSDIGSVTIKLQ